MQQVGGVKFPGAHQLTRGHTVRKWTSSVMSNWSFSVSLSIFSPVSLSPSVASFALICPCFVYHAPLPSPPSFFFTPQQSCCLFFLCLPLFLRDFLPRGSGIVTRRPLILQLVNNKAGECCLPCAQPTSLSPFITALCMASLPQCLKLRTLSASYFAAFISLI